jgi:two-component system sensor histidine kinase YesM
MAFILMIVPFLISGILTYRNYVVSIENKTKLFSKQLASQINLTLDNHLEELNKLTIMPLYEDDVIDTLKKHNLETYDIGNSSMYETNQMGLFISSLSFDRPEIYGISIIANDGTFFSNLQKDNYQYEDPEKWMDMRVDSNKPISIVPPHLVSYYGTKPSNVFSIVRRIKDPVTSENLGIIKIDILFDVFRKILKMTSFSDDTALLIIDDQNNIYYSNENNAEGLEAAGNSAIEPDDKNQISIVNSSGITGLNVVVLVDDVKIHKDSMAVVRFSTIIALISIMISMIAFTGFSKKLVKPIIQLKDKMNKVQEGSWKERVDVSSNDEIGDLSKGFNAMIRQIETLVEEVYETSLHEKDAELAALQSQINPHFLYNSFEFINMTAIENDQYEISDLISGLGKLMRYTVDKKNKIVTVNREVEFIENYLKFVNYSMGDRIKSEIAIDDGLGNCLVPKLILQPLVENAIKHGIGDNEGSIEIRIYKETDSVSIVVKDNGVGMSGRQLETLHQTINTMKNYFENKMNVAGKTNPNGVALGNINHRIKLLYGDRYGLSLKSKEGVGTTVKIMIPYRVRGDNEVG